MLTALSDTEMILVILGLFYLYECIVWLPETALVFTSTVGRFRIAVFPRFLKRASSHAALLSLFPDSRSLVTEDWPVAVSPDGISIVTGPHAGHYLAFDDLKSVKADQKKLQINSITVTCAASDCSKQLVTLLTDLQTKTNAERAELIETSVKSRFCLAGSSGRLETVERFASIMRMFSLFLFLWVFVYGPVLYYTVEPRPGMLFRYFTPLGLLWFSGVVMTAIAQRRLLTHSSSEQISRVATLCFSPAGVMRAAHTITREAFSGCDPSALAVVVLPPEAMRELLGQRLRNLMYPALSEIPDSTEDYRETCRWFYDLQIASFKTLLSETEITTEELLASPHPDYDALSWCPRCLAQYTLSTGMCPDCPDVSLQVFEAGTPDISST